MAEYDVTSGVTSTGIILNNDSMYVQEGGTANNTTVNDWGILYVSSGGVANSTTLSSGGWLRVFSGGVANSTTVNENSLLDVYSGATAISRTICWCVSIRPACSATTARAMSRTAGLNSAAVST